MCTGVKPPSCTITNSQMCGGAVVTLAVGVAPLIDGVEFDALIADKALMQCDHRRVERVGRQDRSAEPVLRSRLPAG